MKFFAVIFAVFALFVAATVGLKNPICGLRESADGMGLIACAAYVPSWTYKMSTNECISFVYGGCGGNENRFGSQAQCEEMCKE